MVEGVPRSRQEAARGWRSAEGTSDEIKDLKAETRQLKRALAEITLENRLPPHVIRQKLWSVVGTIVFRRAVFN